MDFPPGLGPLARPLTHWSGSTPPASCAFQLAFPGTTAGQHQRFPSSPCWSHDLRSCSDLDGLQHSPGFQLPRFSAFGCQGQLGPRLPCLGDKGFSGWTHPPPLSMLTDQGSSVCVSVCMRVCVRVWWGEHSCPLCILRGGPQPGQRKEQLREPQ